MIDEAIGKILGMAMAYGVSVLGMFLAYVNYRKRTVKAEKVMTPTAWAVVAVTVLMVAGGVFVVSRLASSSSEARSSAEAVATEQVAESLEATGVEPAGVEATGIEGPRSRWPWIGIVVPAAIFLLATVLTAELHRHFSHPTGS